jgi:hypothetical protein
MKTKYPHHSEEEFLVMIFFIRFKRTHNPNLKKPQSVEACRKKSIDPFIISEYFEILGGSDK